MALPNLSAAKQELYSESMLTLLKEDLGGKAVDICEVVTGKGSKAIVYRIKSSDVTKDNGSLATSTAMNLYKNDGDGGDLVGIEIPTKVILSGSNLSLEEIQTTSLDLKGGYTESHKRTVNRKADQAVMDAIRASVAAGDITAVSHTGKKFSDDEVALDVVSYVLEALDEVEVSQDHRPDVRVFMNKADRRALYTNKAFLSSDFKEMINGSMFGKINKAEIVGYKDATLVPAGEAYIVPADSIGFGKIEGTEFAGIEWAAGIAKFQVTAGISAGAVVADPEAIIVISTK